MNPQCEQRRLVFSGPTYSTSMPYSSALFSTYSYRRLNAHLCPHDSPVRSRMSVKFLNAITEQPFSSASPMSSLLMRWRISLNRPSCSRPIDWMLWCAHRVPCFCRSSRRLLYSCRQWSNSSPVQNAPVLATARLFTPRSTPRTVPFSVASMSGVFDSTSVLQWT